jgi:hypothetical protein
VDSRRALIADVAVGIGLLAVGAMYAVYAVFLVPQRLGGVLGLSLVVTAAGNIAVGLLAGWTMRSRRAALWPIAGWFLVTAVFSLAVGPGGDIVLPGGLPNDPGVVTVGEFNWAAGLVSSVVVLLLSARLWGVRRPASPGPPTSRHLEGGRRKGE